MTKYQPKTLARVLAYIGLHSPAEFGLFWDPDGTMPWKEFYWALQEDPSLRFVRESNLRELALLGIEMPFCLDGNLLRLASGTSPPAYPAAVDVPERLYFAGKTKNLVMVQKFGLRSVSRPFIPLCAERELALRIGKRRDPEAIVIEVAARRAAQSGVSFLVAGPLLYLVGAVALDFLILPRLRDDLAARLVASGPKKGEKPSQKPLPASPGSFMVQPHHLQTEPGEKPVKRTGRKEKTGWKKESRKERDKRNV